MTLPASITKNATWCSGPVTVTLKRGIDTVGSTTVNVRPDCTYARTVSVERTVVLAFRGGRTRGTLKLGARFGGNLLLKARSATPRTVAYGRR